jgi:hypothetical protein
MDFIAVIDFEHLDNGLFLSAFSRSLSQLKDKRGLIIHGDSEYTNRLIQTGMMREDAVIRAAKDLNHRLIALFADNGIATIGLNGYQRSLIKQSEGSLLFDDAQFQKLPHQPMLLLSNLVAPESGTTPVPIPLAEYAGFLKIATGADEILVFNLDDRAEFIKQDQPEEVMYDRLLPEVIERQIPEEFRGKKIDFRLLSANSLASFPAKSGSMFVKF